MEHPNKEQRENQANFLAQLPKDQRNFHAQMFRLGNAAFIYHSIAKRMEPTEKDFLIWLENIPNNIANDMRAKGFEACKGILSFTRYINEKNDIGMNQWMRENLSKNDYNTYIEKSLVK